MEEDVYGKACHEKACHEKACHYRKVMTIPYGINRSVDKAVIPFVRNAVAEMAKCNFWGSRFVIFHLTKMLSEGHAIPEFTKLSMRPLFFMLAEGNVKGKFTTMQMKNSLKDWNEHVKQEARFSIRGLNTVATKTWETYWNAFEQYHTYAIVSHLAWLLSWKNKKLKKYESDILAKKIAIDLGIKSKPSVDEDEVGSEKLRDFASEVYKTELLWCKARFQNYGHIGHRIAFHYEIMKALEQIDDAPRIRIAPLASCKLPFIELSKKALQDMHSFAKSKHCPLSDTEKQQMWVLFNEEQAKNIKLEQILNDKELKRTSMLRCTYDYGPTISTDGVQVHIPWQAPYVLMKRMNEKEYKKSIENDKKWAAKKAQRIKEATREDGTVDLRVTRKREPKILPPMKDRLLRQSFSNAKNGLFHITSTESSSIENGTPIVSIDPGHRDVVSSAIATWNADSKDDYNPKKHFRLSLGEYYHKIGNRAYHSSIEEIKKKRQFKPVLETMSINSLKMSDFSVLTERVATTLELFPRLFSLYGTRNHARRRFGRVQSKQRFYDTIVDKIAPNPKTIIAMGDAKFATCTVGLSATPIAKIVSRLSRERRVVMTPETCTTMRCSRCRTLDVNTIQAISSTKQVSKRTGHGYYPGIHGLRHCQQCTQSWNRDFNAA